MDFGDLPLFEATAYPCILVGQKQSFNPETDKVKTLSVKVYVVKGSGTREQF